MTGEHRGRIGVALWAVVAMAGCARSPQAARSVPYLRAHPQALQTLVRWCTADPGLLEHRPVCVNAREAALLKGIGSFRKLAPMAFPAVPGNPSPRRGSVAPAHVQR
jgi:hypothetical protein